MMAARLLKFSEWGSVLVLGLWSLSVVRAEAQPQGVPEAELEPVAVIDPVLPPVEVPLRDFELILSPVVSPMDELEPMEGAWSIRRLSTVSGAGLDSVGPEALSEAVRLKAPGEIDQLETRPRIRVAVSADVLPVLPEVAAVGRVAPQRPVKAETAAWSLVPFRIWVDSQAGRYRQRANEAEAKGEAVQAAALRLKYWQVIERTAARRELHRRDGPSALRTGR